MVFKKKKKSTVLLKDIYPMALRHKYFQQSNTPIPLGKKMYVTARQLNMMNSLAHYESRFISRNFMKG